MWLHGATLTRFHNALQACRGYSTVPVCTGPSRSSNCGTCRSTSPTAGRNGAVLNHKQVNMMQSYMLLDCLRRSNEALPPGESIYILLCGVYSQVANCATHGSGN